MPPSLSSLGQTTNPHPIYQSPRLHSGNKKLSLHLKKCWWEATQLWTVGFLCQLFIISRWMHFLHEGLYILCIYIFMSTTWMQSQHTRKNIPDNRKKKKFPSFPLNNNNSLHLKSTTFSQELIAQLLTTFTITRYASTTWSQVDITCSLHTQMHTHTHTHTHFFGTSLSFAGNSGQLTWVRRSSHKSSATHSCQCVQYFHVSKQRGMVWLPVFRIFVECTDVDACDCKQGLYRKNPLLHWGLKPTSAMLQWWHWNQKTTAQPKTDKWCSSPSHFHHLLVWVLFCSLIKWITPKFTCCVLS